MGETMDTWRWEPEWRAKPLRERLAYALEHDLFVDDVALEFSGQRHTLKAHANILAHCSPVLEEHFYGSRKGEALRGVDPRGLRFALSVLYNVPPHKLNLHDETIVLLILAHSTARSLRINRLEDRLKKDIFAQIRLEADHAAGHFWMLLELCRALRDKDIEDRLLEYAQLHCRRLLRDDAFLALSPGTVLSVLDLDCLQIPEIDVLESVARWFDSNRSSLPFAELFLRDMLFRVRFRGISNKEFRDFLRNHWELLPSREAMQIVCHLQNPGMYKLPDWCCLEARLPPVLGSTLRENALLQDNANTDYINLKDMLKRKRFTDTCFLVGPRKEAIRAHRNILAIGSQVFEKMFYGSLATSEDCFEINTLHPPGSQTSSTYAEGFKAMIQYFYDESSLDQLSDVTSVFEASLKYGSEHLRRICTMRCEVTGTPNVANFWKHLEYLMILGSRDKINKVYLPFASEYIKALLKYPAFLRASCEAVAEVLELDHLCIGEADLLRHVIRWVRYDARRETFKARLVKGIRFSEISLGEFVSVMAEHGEFFTSDECKLICVHLHDRTSELPEGCSAGEPRRRVSGRRVQFSPNPKGDDSRKADGLIAGMRKIRVTPQMFDPSYKANKPVLDSKETRRVQFSLNLKGDDSRNSGGLIAGMRKIRVTPQMFDPSYKASKPVLDERSSLSEAKRGGLQTNV